MRHGSLKNWLLLALFCCFLAVVCAAQESATSALIAGPEYHGGYPIELPRRRAFGDAIKQHFGSPPLPRDDEVSPDDSSAAESGPRVSLREAILISIERNPEFAIVKLGPEEAAQEVLSAQGAFDTFFIPSVSQQRAVDPDDSPFNDGEVTNEQFDFGLALQQKLPTGADVAVSWHNFRSTTDSMIARLSPAWESGLALNISQPLLRGTGWGVPQVRVRISRRLESAAQYAYQGLLATQVRRLIESYWSVVLAKQVVQVRRESLNLAKRLRRDVSEIVKVGLAAPLALTEAESEVARNREELIVAQNDLLNAGRDLRRLMGVDFRPGMNEVAGYGPFQAIDRPEFAPVHFDQDLAVAQALDQRPELKAQNYRVRAAELSLRLASNEVLPQLNLKGGVGVRGLAGTDKGSISFGDEPLPPNPFPGGFDDAVDLLDSGDYYNYKVALEFEMPLENRAARASYNQQRIALLREQYRMRVLKQNIMQEVLKAVADLNAAYKRVKAAEEAVKYSRESLNVARSKLQAGLSTVREMLEVQRDAAEAELKKAQAYTDHLVAIAEVYRGRGDILAQFGISVEAE